MQYKEKYIWALIGRFLPLFIFLATTMILARFLTPSDFGKVGVLSVFFMVASTLMDAGLGGSLVKEEEIKKGDCSTIFVFNVVVSVLLYALVFLFSDVIENYFATSGLSSVVKILCLVFVINSFGLVPRSLLTRNLQFEVISSINVVSVVVSSVISVILAIMHFGVYALVAYYLASAVVTVLLSIKLSGFKISIRFSGESLRRLIPFGIFTTLTTAIDTVYENLIVLLFGKYMDMFQAGCLSQAKRIEEVPSQSLALTISSVAFPILTKLRKEEKQFAQECNNTFKNILLCVLPLLFAMSVFSKIIVSLLFGEQWLSAAPYLSQLAFAAVFHIAETLNRTFIKSTTQVEKLMTYTLIKRIIGISVIFLFLSIDAKMTLVGYIISTFIGYVFNVHLLARVSSVCVSTQFVIFGKILFPNILLYVLMLLSQKFIDNYGLAIILSTVLILLYYFVILRFYNINIIKSVKGHIQHRHPS